MRLRSHGAPRAHEVPQSVQILPRAEFRVGSHAVVDADTAPQYTRVRDYAQHRKLFGALDEGQDFFRCRAQYY